MKENEKIIDKIKKVLELSRNNNCEGEAKAAALKAQQLMAQYHISMAEVEENADEAENIVENSVKVGKGNKWKYSLAQIVAKNFRCRYFLYGRDTVVFYGYETDAEIAAETFRFLFDEGNRAAGNFYMKMRNKAVRNGGYFDGTGIKNNFLVGYLDGIREGLEKQCTALMIVVPKEVNEKYAEMSAGFRTLRSSAMKTQSYYSHISREEGRRTGRDTISGKKIAMA